jgi:hypothetical protein
LPVGSGMVAPDTPLSVFAAPNEKLVPFQTALEPR